MSVAAKEYTDPETKVVYTYDPNGATAAVKAGYDLPYIPESDDEVLIEYYPGSPEASGDIAILDKFIVDGKEYTVTAISMRAFQNNKNITSITIPETVTDIGDQAFWDCKKLQTVILPETITSINSGVFMGCSSLMGIDLPLNLIMIEASAFYLSGLTEITIPSGVTSLGWIAFYSEQLISVVSYIEEPFECEAFGTEYSTTIYDRATLYVPKGSKAKYEATNGWKQFKKIKEIEVMGISDVSDTSRLNDKGQMTNDNRGNGDCKSPITYNLNGQRLTQKPEKGVYIENGRKRVVK